MGQPVATSSAFLKETQDHSDRAAWQRKLLPFMVSMLALMAIVAVVSNFYQAHVMREYIGTVHDIDLTPTWNPATLDNATAADQIAWAQWRTLALLESTALRNRNQRANAVLMGRVYLIFIGFSIGVMMSLIGAVFILGKMQEPLSKVESGTGAWRFAVESSSPGLILAVLGTTLILATIWSRSVLEVEERPLYVSDRLRDASTAEQESKSPLKVEDDILRSLQKAEETKTKK